MLVLLDSPEGQRRLEECAAATKAATSPTKRCGIESVLQRPMVDAFRKQRGNTVCGLASLAIILTARNRCKSIANTSERASPREECNHEGGTTTRSSNDHPDDILFVDEDDVYPRVASSSSLNDNRSGTNGLVSEAKIRTSGMTLEQIRTLAEALPTTEQAVAIVPATTARNPLEKGGSETFPHDAQDLTKIQAGGKIQTLSGSSALRQRLFQSLSKPPSNECLVLNYHMSTLGQVPFGGHLSPIAAYHQPSDSLLVLDVWHTQTEPFWATVEAVWKSCVGIDPESQNPRGLLRVVHRR